MNQSVSSNSVFSSSTDNNRTFFDDGSSSGKLSTLNEDNTSASSIYGDTTAEKLLQKPTTEQQILKRNSAVNASGPLSINNTVDYTVKAGDTLSKLATVHGVSVEVLAAENNILDPNKIYIGDELRIPTVNTQVDFSYDGHFGQTYRIKAGDTLAEIAKRFDTSIADLSAINNISNPNRIYAGDVLNVPHADSSRANPSLPSMPLGSDDREVDISAIVDAVPIAVKRANPDVASHVERIVVMADKHGLTPEQTAYVLATATHESAMGAYMEEFASGRAYEGRRDLGNTEPGDGVKFKGRGYVQITGRSNYQDWSNRLGVDLVNNPELAENPSIAAEILVVGMKEGTFTGRQLSDYINDGSIDFENARRIVNGKDRAALIADYAESYQSALSVNIPRAVPQENANIASPQTPIAIGAEGSHADVWGKPTANIDRLSNHMTATFDEIVASWQTQTDKTPVITSGNDGRHMQGSLHYQNQALDLRANNISDVMSQQIASDLQRRLGNDYDVIFEHFPSNPSNDHIHVEYDPN